MTRTLTAFFDNRSDAVEAADRLAEAGVARNAVRILPEHGEDTTSSSYASSASSSASGSSYDVERDEKGFWESLGDLFFPAEDRHTYAEAMNRGTVMVTATVDDEMAEQAEDILDDHGTVNIDERETAWRSEGWGGWQGHSGDGGSDTGTTGRSLERRDATDSDEVIPVAEEEIRVGKREVDRGKVKVRSYVVESPVSEDVSLREESVHVERRPADRALRDGEAGELFQDRTIELEERGEEAVVSKTARVREEVAVGKTVEERTETVRDKVRRTEVEIEDERSAGGTSSQNKRRSG